MNPFSSLQRWLGARLDDWSPVCAVFSLILAGLFWLRGSHIALDNLAAFLWPSLWGSLIVAILCSVRAKRSIFFIASAAFISNFYLLSPWLFENQFAVKADVSQSYPYSLKLAVANVQTENRVHARVVKWVADFKPDILILIEVDERWLEGVAAIESELPQTLKDPRDNNFGIAVYSRYPLLSKTPTTFSEEGIQSLEILVNAPGGPARVLATHALPPVSAAWAADRNRHLQRIGAWSRGVSEDLIVAGDLNVAPWSTHYLPIETGGLRNIRPRSGLLASWPTFFPAWMRVPIDHVLSRGAFVLKSARLGPDLASDHMPLEVEFVR